MSKLQRRFEASRLGIQNHEAGRFERGRADAGAGRLAGGEFSCSKPACRKCRVCTTSSMTSTTRSHLPAGGTAPRPAMKVSTHGHRYSSRRPRAGTITTHYHFDENGVISTGYMKYIHLSV
jgi:hypothetical protein